MNMNLTMNPVAGAAPLRRSRRKPKTYPNFPLGAVIQPKTDQIGGYLHEHNRRQLCVTEEDVVRLKDLSSRLGHSLWKMGYWVHRRLGPPRNGVTPVITTNYGYRAEHWRPRSYACILGNALAESPLLFPTSEAAIAAAGVALHEVEEGWMFKWLHYSCGLNATS
jgi:hypothetical protein